MPREADWDSEAEGLLSAIEHLAQGITNLRRDFEALRGEQMRYLGVWQGAQSYQRGSVVTHGGSIWHANATTTAAEKPGSSGSWQLMTKTPR
jgi:hypothetical protein